VGNTCYIQLLVNKKEEQNVIQNQERKSSGLAWLESKTSSGCSNFTVRRSDVNFFAKIPEDFQNSSKTFQGGESRLVFDLIFFGPPN
jgi:hypothetical protein